MVNLWTAKEIAEATDGAIKADFSVTGTVHIDSRKIAKGDLFIAIEGDTNDGHAFLDKAFATGAAGALVHKEMPHHSVVVNDTFKAMEHLAQYSVKRSKAKRIAITGSVGKTGTKELMAAGFSAVGATHATEGNLNNHFGLPLTCARMPQASDFAVLELGMNHAGEISELTQIARPHVALITRIAPAHTEFFDSIEDIARAKAEIFEGVESEGFALLNRDDPFFPLLAEAAEKQQLTIKTFGLHPNADARLVSIKAQATGGQSLSANIAGETLTFNLALNGQHYGLSAMGVLLAAHVLNQDLEAIAANLSLVKPMAGRGQITEVSNKILLIDEAYNASPTAMEAAFGVLNQLADARGKGRRVAILGDMLELGDEGPHMHAALSDALNTQNIDVLLGCGPLMQNLCAPFAKNSDKIVQHFDDSQALAKTVFDFLEQGDTVLVKGSLGSAMTKVCDALKSGTN